MRTVLLAVLGILGVIVVSGCTQSIDQVVTAEAPEINSLSELSKYLDCDIVMMQYTNDQSASKNNYYYGTCQVGDGHIVLQAGKLYNVEKSANAITSDGSRIPFEPVPYTIGDNKALVHFINNVQTIGQGSEALFCGECDDGDDFFMVRIVGEETVGIAENILTPKGSGKDFSEFEEICAMDDFNCLLYPESSLEVWYREGWMFQMRQRKMNNVGEYYNLFFDADEENIRSRHSHTPIGWIFNKTELDEYLKFKYENVAINGSYVAVDTAFVSVNETNRVCVYHNRSKDNTHAYQSCGIRINDDYIAFSISEEEHVNFETHEIVSALISKMG
jgi:hypothetical protein